MRERDAQFEHVLASAVAKAMPVQMRRLELRREHRLDLGPELQFELVKPRLRHQLIQLVHTEELAGLIKERRHLLLRDQRPPPMPGQVADNRQMNAERDLRMPPEQLDRM